MFSFPARRYVARDHSPRSAFVKLGWLVLGCLFAMLFCAQGAPADGTTVVAPEPQCHNSRVAITYFRDSTGAVAWFETRKLQAINPCPAPTPQPPRNNADELTAR